MFSAWMKTIQKLDKDMVYAKAKQATKQPTIHVSAWPHPLEAAPISLIAGSDSVLNELPANRIFSWSLD